MKILNWLLLILSAFFLAWFVVDHISIYVINHGIFSTVIGNFLEPYVGTSVVNWLIWFAILFGWLGIAVGYYFWKHPKTLGF